MGEDASQVEYRERFGSEAPASPNERDAVELTFSSILESQTFRQAPTLRRLLSYLWEHKGGACNQYALGVDVLGRKPDFDPKTDAAVRVQIARLRQRLKEFYEVESPGFPLRLSIPHGSTQLVCSFEDPGEPARSPDSARRETRPHRSLVIALAVSCALLSAALGFIAVDKMLSSRSSQGDGLAQSSVFWRSFLGNGRPAELVVPTHVYLFWEDPGIAVRDVRLTQFERWRERPALRLLAKAWGAPKLSQDYTAVRDTFAVIRLIQWLERHGIQTRISSTPNVPAELPEANLIFSGVPGSSPHIERHLRTANFHMNVGTSRVLNRNPKPGEEAEYDEQRHSDRRLIQPGILALFPGSSPNTKLLLLTGCPTTALATLLTSSEGLKTVDARLGREGNPPYFEMLLMAEIDGDTVLRVWPKAFRPYANVLQTHRNTP